MTVVKKFEKPVKPAALGAILAGSSPATIPLENSIELDGLLTEIAKTTELFGSELDVALVEPVHVALPLSRRDAADARTWHWLCAEAVPTFVWRRWAKGEMPKPPQLEDALSNSLRRRYLGSSTLNGVSRNTLARLWWLGETLGSDGNYDLARKAVAVQDKFQAVFERTFGLYPPAAKAFVERFDSLGETEVRDRAKWLQQCGSTTLIESLTADEIGAIIDAYGN